MVQLFKRMRELDFERSYGAPVGVVWEAWTRPEMLREWWGPENTTVTDCEVDLRIRITEIGSGAKMGAFGMKWGYKQQLDQLETYLAADGHGGRS